MLQSKYNKDQIVSFKLVNGDEVVAKIVEQTPAGFEVSKPCLVIPSQQGLGLMQALFTSELNNNVTLEKSHVMLHAPTVEAVQNHYVQTTTGIQPVTNGGIIT